MQTTTVSLECDVTFNEEAELEVLLYVEDALAVGKLAVASWGSTYGPIRFKFNLIDILEANVDMFTIPTEPPYIKHDDTDARGALYTLAKRLKAGAACVEELQNKYLDNEPIKDKPNEGE